MKKNYILIFLTTFLLMLISTAYAAFSSELIISGEGIVEKDNIPPTCGAWYLRDSNLTVQEAYNQNKFKNPATNTTWTNENQKLFIECTDNMDGDYGCINVTEITDSNNQKRYYKEVKEYISSVKTDSNVVTVSLKDAYQNERTCSLPVGGSNPYLDKTGPEITITPTAYNKFTYSATDDIGVTGYMVTTTPVEPSIDDSNWIDTPVEITIDNTQNEVYYIWAKDEVNISHERISTYQLSKDEAEGTTLTLKYGNNTGIDLSTGYVIDGTIVYVEASLKNGYTNLTISKNNTNITNPSTVTINENTIISSNATFNGIYAYFNPAGGSVDPILKGVFTGEVYGELPIPEKEGYSFAGWSELPSGYIPIEYIESTGTQYIDTGIIANQNTGFEIDFLTHDIIQASGHSLFGSRENYKSRGYQLTTYNDTSLLGHLLFGTNDSVTNIRYSAGIITNTRQKIKLLNKVLTLPDNSTTNVTNYNFNTPSTITLFALHENSSIGEFSNARIYNLKFYSGSNLIRNYIPAINASSGETGLYDLVEGIFYGNDGTGKFISGPRKFITSTSIVERTTDHTLTAVWDKKITVTFDSDGGSVNPTTKYVINNNQYGELPTPEKSGYAFAGWSELPSGYTPLEYIESTGTQWIDTGTKFNSNSDKFELIFKANDSNGNYFIAGSGYSEKGKIWVYNWNSGNRFAMYINDTDGTQREFIGLNTVDAQKHKVTFDAKKLYVDESLTADGSSYTFGDTPYNFSLFNALNSTGYIAKTKIYSFKMWKSGVLIRNMVPVINNSTGKAGLYDLVSNTFYGNDGTGEFITGPRKFITSTSIVQKTTDHTLTAIWDKKFVVTFDPNGGSVDPTTKEVVYKNEYGELPVPSKTNYAFNNWVSSNYQELYYIESTGTQYINTNYYVTNKTAIDVDYKFNVLTQQQRVYGVAGDVSFQFYINSADSWAYSHQDTSGNWFNTGVKADMKKHNLKFNVTSGKVLIDNGSSYNADINGSVTKTANYPLYIMVNNETGTVNCQGTERIYYFKIYENGVLVRDYIPVRRLSDNSLGLLDKITNTFYQNAGTGTFIAGPEINRKVVDSATLVTTYGDHTLFAKWDNIYTLSINPNGGTYNSSSGVTTAILKYPEVYNVLNPLRSGYTFLGWNELSSTNSSTGLTDIAVYNNKGNGVVTVTSQSKSSDNPLSTTANEYKIVNSGSAEASPGLGGFRQTMQTEPNHVYVHVFVAKLPVGYYFYEAYNPLGTGFSVEWLTSNEGTGKWQTYAYKVKSGSSGSFSTMGFVYVTKTISNIWDGAVAETGSYTAYLGYSSIFDVTANNNGIGQLDGTASLTARWGTTLTANPNGGSFNGSTSNTTYTKDVNSLQVLPYPTRTGYTFNGWTKSGGGTVTKYGKPLYTDDTFNSGANSMSVYNNSANGTVTHTRVATTADNPLKKSSYVMQITTNGTASPGLGGFYQNTQSRANAVFYHVIVAKIPIGYTIQHAENQTGTGRTIEWLTSQAGTGKYETYIYKHTCGSSGSFSTFGHVYISGNVATSTNPVTWYVAFANMFDYSSGTPNNSSQVFTYGDTNTTVTANWSVNSYTLTYNNNGGSGCSSKTGTYGSTWGSLCTPSRSGYTFQGWYTAASGGSQVTASTTVSGNQTVYAHWNLSSVFAYLGQGTSFNIKSKYPLIYDKLNANNFIISVSSMPSISAAGQTNMHQYITGNLTGFNLSKSYNASTGVLTISGNGFKIYGCYDDSYVNCSDASASGTVSPYVYLNYNYSTVYDLGTGTSFNIKSKYPSLYSSLTANNFIVGTTSISNLHTEGWTNPHRYLSGKTSGFNITKSYNASTGILTVSGNSYNLQFCGDDSYLYCADANVPGSFSPRVYLYK